MGTRRQAERWRAWQLFFETHAGLSSELESSLQRQHGLSLRRFDVLLQLANAPRRRLLMGELADAAVISKSGLSGLVERMEGDGLLARQPVPADRRATSVELTEAGARLYRSARRTHERDVQERFLDALTDADARSLTGMLERVAAAQA